MKLSFTTLDVIAMVSELQSKIVGYRIYNVYDIDNKTYLLRLSSNNGEKVVLLLESGTRVHLTEYEWPKNMMPSGFSMKLRKHVKNKRVSSVVQLGMDRIIDMRIGSEEYLYHLIIELYDRGNMMLTDRDYKILHLLRPRTDTNKDVRYAAHQCYPLEVVRRAPACLQDLQTDAIKNHTLPLLLRAKGPWTNSFVNSQSIEVDKGTTLLPVKTVLASEFAYGGPCIEHCCRLAYVGVKPLLDEASRRDVVVDTELVSRVYEQYAFGFASALRQMILAVSGDITHADGDDEFGSLPRGYVFGKALNPDGTGLLSQEEFHPFLFEQLKCKTFVTYNSYSKAVDAFFSCIESQRTAERLDQLEKKASRKVENIKKDHELRLSHLKDEQELDIKKAHLIELNQNLVDGIILMLNHALSNQLDWSQLEAMLSEARKRGDPLAQHISSLNLQVNQVVLRLGDSESANESDGEIRNKSDSMMDVIIDLGINAQNNARKHYDKRRAALNKEQKTLVATQRAMKSAAVQAQQTLKDANTIVQIAKVRKPMWFEKFFWFISSENYLVVAGRDSQQNEMLVKRYLRPGDIYVHADLHGASSVIVKARPPQPDELKSLHGNNVKVDGESSDKQQMPLPPPKTLTEAGVMAVVFSSAWSARVVTSAWWVHHDQVSKTAPSGEYLSTGAFMIRGRKNYLLPCHLMYGFGILFKLDDDSAERHRGERKIIHLDSDYSTLQLPNEIETKDNMQKPFSGLQPEDSIADDLDAVHFPDTLLQLDLTKKTIVKPETRGISKQSTSNVKPTTVPSSNQKKDQGKGKSDSKPVAVKAKVNQVIIKRGQRSKLKKIRQKYGDQDEDERALRMQVLQGPSGKPSMHHSALLGLATSRVDADHGSGSIYSLKEDINKQASPGSPTVVTCSTSSPSGAETSLGLEDSNSRQGADDENAFDGQSDGDEELDKDEEILIDAEDDTLPLLSTLTGQPGADDILLYAMPVCAPYTTLTNYKFKVKLTPGTTKRGKASKMALHQFSMDRSATTREKDLIRAIKGEDAPRIFPGFVKVTLPHGGSVTKRKK